MDVRNVIFEIGEYFLGGFASPEIVASGAQEDFARLVWKNDPVSEMRRIHDFGSAETAIDDGMSGKIFGERFPKTNG